MKQLITFFFSILVAQLSVAQDSTRMADVMRGNGKIYVVVAVMVTILIGLIIYVARLDRKITKLERNTR
jgi:hypothetical protein